MKFQAPLGMDAFFLSGLLQLPVFEDQWDRQCSGILLQQVSQVCQSSCLDSEGVSHHFHKPYFLLEGAFRHYMKRWVSQNELAMVVINTLEAVVK